MGLSRNKVAVSEGAAGSPPFYGDTKVWNKIFEVRSESERRSNRCLILKVFRLSKRKYGGIAQLGEHLLCKQGVSGSIPLISTRPKGQSKRVLRIRADGTTEYGLVAQVVRAHA